jgi:hypothetical protein
MILRKEKNILTLLLSLLKIKYTKSFSDKLYNEHPYKDNLLGISKMLSKYGIESKGLKLADNRALLSLDVPIVTIYNNQFIIIYKITHGAVYYIHNGEKKEIVLEDFFTNWTNVILVIEADENSIEPDYSAHKKEEVFKVMQKPLLIITCILSGSILYVTNQFFNSVWISLLIILNTLGVYVSYLLLMKQLHIHSTAADKICLSLHNGNCNSVLDSSSSKLLGTFSWSEIGFSYFISNIIIILIFSRFINLIVLINIIALPYSFWSVWYQKFKVKQWCVLCLIVQALLWAIFIVNLSFQSIHVTTLNLTEISIVSSAYIILLLATHIFISKTGSEKMNKEIVQKMNNLKMNEEIFSFLLKSQSYYPVDKSVSKILFGNTQSNNLITIVTNPYCNACALMHKKVIELMKMMEHKVCVQYIISTFSPSLEFTEKFLIGAYFQNDSANINMIYESWFEKGRSNTMNFINNYDINIENKDVKDEFEKHKTWLSLTKINATPTILVNGFQLPDIYKIDDLELLFI